MGFSAYKAALDSRQLAALESFFAEFDSHCLLSKLDKSAMREDFERAMVCHGGMGLSPEESLRLLNTRNLGGFYARPPVVWFPLDDAAKIYPLSMEHGSMSMFRLSVNLRDAVRPELLQMALTFTIKRFPSFAATLKKGIFWHYLDSTKRRFVAEKETGLPCQPLKVSHSGSTAFRVLYYEKRISVEFFHMLTDGTGGTTFLKVLTAEYLRLCGREIGTDASLWDSNATPTAAEFENAFDRVPPADTPGGFMDRSSVQLTGRLARHSPCRIIHFRMPVDALKAAAKRYDVTVTVYLLGLMFLAGQAATEELSGECSIQVPVNMRKYYPSPTVRNFSMYCAVRERLETMGDRHALMESIARQLQHGSSCRSVTELATAAARLVKALRYIPLVIKQPVAQLICNFLNDNAYTNIFSNLGPVTLPEAMSSHIESLDFALGTYAKKRVACAGISINGCMTFTVTKNIVDPSFEEKMYELLLADGICAAVEGSELYED